MEATPVLQYARVKKEKLFRFPVWVDWTVGLLFPTLLAMLIVPALLDGDTRTHCGQYNDPFRAAVSALDLHQRFADSYPSHLNGLMIRPPGVSIWRGPYVPDNSAFLDRWNHPLEYTESTGCFLQTIRLRSAGPDGLFNTPDDLVFRDEIPVLTDARTLIAPSRVTAAPLAVFGNGRQKNLGGPPKAQPAIALIAADGGLADSWTKRDRRAALPYGQVVP